MTGSRLISLFEQRVQHHGARTALHYKQDISWRTLTWRSWFLTAERYGAALLGLGVSPGDRVCLLSRTRVEWPLLEFGALMIGAVLVPIYPSSMPAQIAHIVEDAGAEVLFVDDPSHLKSLTSLDLSSLRVLGYFDSVSLTGKRLERLDLGDLPDPISLDALSTLGRRALAKDFECVARRRREVCDDDLATIVYTSGTLGEPRGVRLTHANLSAEIDALSGLGLFSSSDRQLLALPLSHIFARVCLYACLGTGMETAIATSVPAMLEEAREIHPTVIAGVPHIFEKVHHGLADSMARRDDPASRWLRRQGDRRARLLRDGLMPRGLMRASEQLLEPLLFRRVRQIFGGSLRFLISGSAPLRPEIAEDLHACGVLVLEGYGLTETCAAVTFNVPEDVRFGSVGRALPGVDLTLAEDGEIYVRGPTSTSGYWRDAEATAGLITEDGWLRTGDIGRFDEDGFLYITGRKKNLIITTGGKNIAPLIIERSLETCPFIEHAVLFGDARPYLVALVTLSREDVEGWAEREGLASMEWSALCEHPSIRVEIDRHVQVVNAQRAGHESVRRVAILEEPFRADSAELTPTFKVRRHLVAMRYAGLLERLYTGRATG